MNIWILNHYAGLPETVPATRTYDIARRLVKKGHSVTIMASSFGYYTLREERLKENKKWEIAVYKGIQFVWIKTFPYLKNDFRRFLNISEYALKALYIGMHAVKKKPDIIIGTCVHPLAPLAAWLLSRKFRVPFCYEVTDLWPQTLVDIEALEENNPITRALYLLEKHLFKKAARIISLLPNVKEYVAEKGIDPSKVTWIPNGVDLNRYDQFNLHIIPNNLIKNGNEYTVAFAGGFSASHGLDTIVETAALLKKMGRHDIHFKLIGQGAEFERIVKLVHDQNLDNVELTGWMPKAELIRYLSGVTVCVAALRDMPLFKYGVSPNKIMDYFMAKRPVIYAIKSSNNVVSEANAGISIRPDKKSELVDAILKIISLSDEQRDILGNNGYNYAKYNFSYDRLADKYERLLMDLI